MASEVAEAIRNPTQGGEALESGIGEGEDAGKQFLEDLLHTPLFLGEVLPRRAHAVDKLGSKAGKV